MKGWAERREFCGADKAWGRGFVTLVCGMPFNAIGGGLMAEHRSFGLLRGEDEVMREEI